jgi:hypothetical protein
MNKQELVEQNEGLVSALEYVRDAPANLDPESTSFESDLKWIRGRISQIVRKSLVGWLRIGDLGPGLMRCIPENRVFVSRGD